MYMGYPVPASNNNEDITLQSYVSMIPPIIASDREQRPGLDEVMTSSDEEKEPGNNENCYEIERAKACIPEYPMNR